MTNTLMSNTEIKLLIENTVSATLSKLGKDGFPFCLLEARELAELKSSQRIMSDILTGDGKPEDGLVYKFGIMTVEKIADRKIIQSFQAGMWSLALIMLGLFATSLWKIIIGN